MSATGTSVDPREVEKFDRLCDQWWDHEGPLKTLHVINPVRVAWIAGKVELQGARVLDVGCGGGILSESLAAHGAHVTGIDLAEGNLAVARAHAERESLRIDYRLENVESVADNEPGSFDIVCCLEVLEHVPSPARIVKACAEALRPGGHLILSTINRNPKSFLLAIVAAEYLLGLVPRGSHEYRRLIRPSELARHCRQAHLDVQDFSGLHYDPLSSSATSGGNIDVNYFCIAQRPTAG